MTLLFLFVLLVLGLWLLYSGRPFLAWLAPAAVGFGIWWLRGIESPVLFWMLLVPAAALAVLFGVVPLRRALVTRRLMPLMAPLFPTMSATERTALEAGSVWWDAELFSGAPDWKRLLDFRQSRLSDAERAFLEGPVDELCAMLDDWRIHRDDDLPPEVWDYIKRERFLGMIIPEEYGGLGFSSYACSRVIGRLSSRSVTGSVTVMVPNSLGPAELLLHYGTKEQKDHYLPRLARGEEVPCFALTEPHAGSDAGSMRSRAVVCKGDWKGEQVLGMRITWSKRYITLSAVASVIGLAFKLYDPDHLLGDEEELDITCALIPADTPGVQIGPRHDPLGVPFVNGTTKGQDVFVPLEFIIGGPKMAGQGWRMLMDCLAAGRGIMLPALSGGACELATRATGAYATVREQFKLPIGRFEGIEEPLAAIGGTTYLVDAARKLTCSAIDSGQKPAVISAIMKAYSTEAMRRVINHAMDVVGGSGISRGPRNILAHAYQAIPIGITVEGANILTRSMIIFGQGAIRCHAYALEEMTSVQQRDLRRFDAALFGHMGTVMTNFMRGSWLGWTRSAFARRPVKGPVADYFAHFERLSAAYATCAEAAMMTLGGTLKRKEMLTGRLADGLAWMYLGTAALKRFVGEGQPERDLPFVRWSAETALHEVQEALLGTLDNLPNRFAGLTLRWKLFPVHSRLKAPSDRLSAKVARALLDGGAAREALTPDVYVPAGDQPGLGRLERALELVVAAAGPRKKLHDAQRAGTLPRKPERELLEEAVQAGVITAEERRTLDEAAAARDDVVQVDAFGEVKADQRSGSPAEVAAS